jgi:hypothetical protein
LQEAEDAPSPEAQRAVVRAKKLASVKERLKPLKDAFKTCNNAVNLGDAAAVACFGVLHARLNAEASDRRLTEGDESTNEVDSQIAKSTCHVTLV